MTHREDEVNTLSPADIAYIHEAVRRGELTEQDAEEMIREAEDENHDLGSD